MDAIKGEIRDRKARHVLETLPYTLEYREPSAEAVAFSASVAVPAPITSHPAAPPAGRETARLSLLPGGRELRLRPDGAR